MVGRCEFAVTSINVAQKREARGFYGYESIILYGRFAGMLKEDCGYGIAGEAHVQFADGTIEVHR
jgi:hypothetical protein